MVEEHKERTKVCEMCGEIITNDDYTGDRIEGYYHISCID